MEHIKTVKKHFLVFVVVRRDRGQLETRQYGLFTGPNTIINAMSTPNMQSVIVREATQQELGV